MNIKSTVTGIIVATTLVAVGPSQAWAYKMHCSGTGWHKVSKHCPIARADNWQDYASGVYLQPMTDKGLLSELLMR